MSIGKYVCLLLSLPFLPFIFMYEYATTYGRGEYNPEAAAKARADGIAKSYAVVYANR